MKHFAILLFCLTTIWAVPIKQKAIQHPTHYGSRIIGGSVARAGQFPYAAAVTYRTTDGAYFCAGTLVANKWIVTAGHCVISGFQFTLHLGSTDRDGADGETVSTYDFVLHPDFSSAPLMNDIGLIQMRLPIAFTDYIRTVDFLATDNLPTGSSTVAIGWGTTNDEDDTFSQQLNYVFVTTLSNDECKITYGNQITDEKVCVDGNFNEGTCGGDSGGPLIQYASRGFSILVGVSSFISQNGCETPDPSGFTRVYPFVDWIRNNTGI